MSLEKSQYSKHFFALSALFVLGNAVITLPPKNADEYNFLGFLVAGIFAVAICFLCHYLSFNKVTASVWSFVAVYIIGDSFVSFIRFIKINLLPQTSPFLIALPFVIIVVFLSLKPQNVLYKFSLISSVLAVFIILLFFLSTAKDFEFRNIFIYSLPTYSQFLKQLLPYLKSVVLPAGLLSVFAKISGFKRGVLISGFGLGFLLLALTVLNSVLLFGMNFAGTLDYPYSSVGSTVTFGNLFTRLDGFIYFLYLVSAIVKCTISIEIIKKSRRIFSP